VTAERGAAIEVVAVRPEPEPAVLAAIAAAVEQAWPTAPPVEPERAATPVWRFSGRWWTTPVPLRRSRPGH